MASVPAHALGALAALALAVATLPAAASAAAEIGHEGPATDPSATAAPTGDKPESKLWWNDGSWWASMWAAGAGENHIFRLQKASQTWADTGVALDGRGNTRADVLWDGQKLYVASHVFGNGSGAAVSRLYRLSYSSASKTYSLDSGFPTTINNVASETLVIDKTPGGRLWATWTAANKVWVSQATADDTQWSAPQAVDGSVRNDDISSVIAFGNKIGVMWSDQNAAAFFFAVRSGGGWDVEEALSGPNLVDDHINLKADASGRVYAAVKTDADPVLRLLVRNTNGQWTDHALARDVGLPTRPIVVLDEANQILHAYYSAETGDTIWEKTSRTGTIDFGPATPVMRTGSGTRLSNATSTKQRVHGASDLVVLASAPQAQRYWHAYVPLPGGLPAPPPPGGSPCTIVGTPGDDVLRGTRRNDVICGLGGDDRLVGRGGKDTLLGGAGADRLSGGGGKDRLEGGGGKDRLRGGGGRDVFKGGNGADTLLARDGRAETVDGGRGRDRAQVDARLDRLVSIAKLL